MNFHAWEWRSHRGHSCSSQISPLLSLWLAGLLQKKHNISKSCTQYIVCSQILPLLCHWVILSQPNDSSYSIDQAERPLLVYEPCWPDKGFSPYDWKGLLLFPFIFLSPNSFKARILVLWQSPCSEIVVYHRYSLHPPPPLKMLRPNPKSLTGG